MRSKRKSKDCRRVVSSEGDNDTTGIESITLHVIRTDRTKAAAPIFRYMPELAFKIT